MRLFISGSAPLLAETHRAFQPQRASASWNATGMTETNMNTSNPLRGDVRAGTVGPALPGVEVRVCDPAGTELRAVSRAAWSRCGGPTSLPATGTCEKTAEELRPSGFFITGDLGVMARTAI